MALILWYSHFNALLFLSIFPHVLLSSVDSESPRSSSDNEVSSDAHGTNLHPDFKYGDVFKWNVIFKSCNGHEQSPINIDTTECVRVRNPQLFWWNYNLKPVSMTLTNNGYTVVLTSEWKSSTLTPYHWHSAGESKEDNFILDHIHFHWGFDAHDGSEHTINNQGYAMELHAVHYSSQLHDITHAFGTKNGIRVVSVLFMISNARNTALDPLIRALPNIQSPSSTTIEPFDIGHLLVRFSSAFATYNGSLTTPPCLEVVTWVVRLMPSTISLDQMNEFRKLRNNLGEPLSGNVRRTQTLNGRPVLHVI